MTFWFSLFSCRYIGGISEMCSFDSDSMAYTPNLKSEYEHQSVQLLGLILYRGNKDGPPESHCHFGQANTNWTFTGSLSMDFGQLPPHHTTDQAKQPVLLDTSGTVCFQYPEEADHFSAHPKASRSSLDPCSGSWCMRNCSGGSTVSMSRGQKLNCTQ